MTEVKKTSFMMRNMDDGSPVSISEKLKENVWAIGRPDYSRDEGKLENVKLSNKVGIGSVIQLADGKFVEVVSPSRSAAAVGQNEVDNSVYIRRLNGEEIEGLKVKQEGYLKQSELQ